MFSQQLAKLNNLKKDQILAWAATWGLLASAALASLNFYPLYVYGFLFSNALWIIVGILWKQKSVIVMNTGLTLIYVIGLILK